MSRLLSSEIDIETSFDPIMVISVFRAENYEGADHYYLEKRPVLSDGKLGAASPLKEETIRKIATAMAQQLTSTLHIDGIISERIVTFSIMAGKERLMWYRKSGVANLYFTSDLGIPDKTYPVPNLLFDFKKGSALMVYAYVDDVLTMDTELYLAPYPNISNGSVCMGSAAVRWDGALSDKDIIRETEEKFFGSRFSHHTSENSLVKGNYQQFMLSLNGVFPTEKLIKTKKRLKDVIR